MPQRPPLHRFGGYLIIWAAGLVPHIVQWEYAGLFRTLLWLGAAGVFFLVAARVGRWLGLPGPEAFGLTLHSGWVRNLALGLLVGVGLTTLNYAARSLLGRFAVVGWAPAGQVITLTTWAIVNSLYTAVWEEMLNRGFLLRMLPQSLPRGWTVLVAAICFSAFHITKWGSPLSAWVFWFCSGLLLTLPYLLTSSLWLSVGLHWGQNFLVYALFEQPSILQITWNQPYPWIADWTGTGAILVLMPVVWLACRRLAAPLERQGGTPRNRRSLTS